MAVYPTENHASIYPNSQQKHVLLVDDDPAILTVLSRFLQQQHYQVQVAQTVDDAARILSKQRFDAVITDVTMPSGNGLQAIEQWRTTGYAMPVIVMSAHNLLLNAAKSKALGAVAFLPKPFDLQELASHLEQLFTKGKNTNNFNVLHGAEEDAGIIHLADDTVLIGKSKAMQEVYRLLTGLIGNDITVMVLGESGTGKELIARALHLFSRRKEKPFIALNMAAIPESLVESTLFGHEKGAFTGAHQQQKGAFAAAEGGTLFLDEIGDMPLHAQTRLLRVLQEGTYSPVGSTHIRKTDMRIITATHKDLRMLVAAEKFREDLFFRLHVVPVTLPPLRMRAEDIPDLVQHFLKEAAEKGLGHKMLHPKAMIALMRHEWPGNVRELKHVIWRLCATVKQVEILASDVLQTLKDKTMLAEVTPRPAMEIADDIATDIDAPFAPYEAALDALEKSIEQAIEAAWQHLPAQAPLKEMLYSRFERPLLAKVMQEADYSQVKAAERLGINRNTLRSKLQKLGLHQTV